MLEMKKRNASNNTWVFLQGMHNFISKKNWVNIRKESFLFNSQNIRFNRVDIRVSLKSSVQCLLKLGIFSSFQEKSSTSNRKIHNFLKKSFVQVVRVILKLGLKKDPSIFTRVREFISQNIFTFFRAFKISN